MTDSVLTAWWDYPAHVKFTLVCSVGAWIKKQIRRVFTACRDDVRPVRKACLMIPGHSETKLLHCGVVDHIDGSTYQPSSRSKELTALGVSPIFILSRRP